MLVLGRGRPLYVLMFPLAAAIVYPDKVAVWFGSVTHTAADWRHVVLFEVVALGVSYVAVPWIVAQYSFGRTWHFAVFVGVLLALRVISWAVSDLFFVDENSY